MQATENDIQGCQNDTHEAQKKCPGGLKGHPRRWSKVDGVVFAFVLFFNVFYCFSNKI